MTPETLPHTLLLRALSMLLTYPDSNMRAALPEIMAEVEATSIIGKHSKQSILALAKHIQAMKPLESEGMYVDLFDRGRRTSLNLFEHVHGDGRQRGPAMLQLRQRYMDAGLTPASDELPDHLPLILEYLSCCTMPVVKDTIGEIAHVLRKLGNTLMGRDSYYAAIMAALLEIGKEKGLDAKAPVPPPEDIDADWEEQPAFTKPKTKKPDDLSTIP